MQLKTSKLMCDVNLKPCSKSRECFQFPFLHGEHVISFLSSPSGSQKGIFYTAVS